MSGACSIGSTITDTQDPRKRSGPYTQDSAGVQLLLQMEKLRCRGHGEPALRFKYTQQIQRRVSMVVSIHSS